MNDFKFACGFCGQHITADAAWAGQQIKCPNCQGDIVIPGGSTPLAPPPAQAAPPPLSIPTQHPAPPPAPHRSGTVYRPAGAQAVSPVKFWLLALASPFLVLMVIPLTLAGVAATESWLGSLAGLLGCIPAVICARTALEERQTRRGVRESPMSVLGAISAWIGLVLGYLWLLLLVIGLCRFGYNKITGQTPPPARWSAPR